METAERKLVMTNECHLSRNDKSTDASGVTRSGLVGGPLIEIDVVL
jgi:hypothetical protein